MQNAKTFRLFISSTFDDFKEERQVLHEKVFPEIENYLKNNHKNYTFQAIDLRWGISTEAQLDQKTLDICLDEVEACKDYPHPNFLVMSGNRYGYVPLPYMIEESEFKSICEYIEKHNEKIVIKYDSELNSQKEVKSQKESIKITPLDLLKSWYVLDKNQIYLTDKNTSTAYILQVREKDYKIYVNWKAEEDALRDILQEAANHIFKSNNKEDEEYKKYFRSATEAEVDKGIINEYTFGFIREIINLDEHKNNVCNKQNPAYTFIDKNQEKAKKFKKKLVDELGSKNILDTEECIEIQKYDNLIKACVELTNDTRKVFLDNTYLDNFSDFMIDRLKYAIEVHMDGVTGLTREQEQEQKQKIEKDSHKKFKDERSSIFVGREELLERIFVYINIDRSNTPLVIYGKSGMGKSALMAESINRVKNKNKNIVYRFVGASADSSNIRSLLISIMDELGDDKYIDSVKEYATNRKKFYAQVRDILENKINKKVTIYIDAIDQLRSYNDLQWLPETLNINLQMIFSVLKDGDYSDDSEYYRSLFEKYSGNFINISRFSLKGSAEDFLKRLLKEKKRELNETQIKSVLDSFKESNYSPLYLKIAIEEIKNWKNDDNTRELKNNVKDIINGYIDNLRQSIGVIVVDKVLAYIHLSKNGLSESELLDILSEDLNDDVDFQKSILNEFHEPIKKKNPRRCNKEEYVLPMAIWSRLHTLLKPFLVEKNIDGHILIKYFHRQFTTVIEERYKDKKKQFYQKLANYFYSLQNKEKQWDKRYYNLHMLDEVPYQLLHAGDSKGLKTVLSDLEFAGSIYDHSKQEGFRDILEQSSSLDGMNKNEIYPWESFYREKEHFIIKVNEEHWKPHQTLFQLMYEDGTNSNLHEKSKQLLNDNKVYWEWLKPENKYLSSEMNRDGTLKIYDDFPRWISKNIFKNKLKYIRISDYSLFIVDNTKNSYRSVYVSTTKLREIDYNIVGQLSNKCFVGHNKEDKLKILNKNGDMKNEINLEEAIRHVVVNGNKIFVIYAHIPEVFEENEEKGKNYLRIYTIDSFDSNSSFEFEDYKLSEGDLCKNLHFVNDEFIVYSTHNHDNNYNDKFYYYNFTTKDLKKLNQEDWSNNYDHVSFLFSDFESIVFELTKRDYEGEYVYSKQTIQLPLFEYSDIISIDAKSQKNADKSEKGKKLSDDIVFYLDRDKLSFIQISLINYSKENIGIKKKILPNNNILFIANENIYLFNYTKELIPLGSGKSLPEVNYERLYINSHFYNLKGEKITIDERLKDHYILDDLNQKLVLSIKTISDLEELNYSNEESEPDGYEEDIFIPIEEISIYNRNLTKFDSLNIYPKGSNDSVNWYPRDERISDNKGWYFDFSDGKINTKLIEDWSFLDNYDIEISNEKDFFVFWIDEDEFIIFTKSIFEIKRSNIKREIMENIEDAICHYKYIVGQWINILDEDIVPLVDKKEIPYFVKNGDLYMKKNASFAIYIDNLEYKILHLVGKV